MTALIISIVALSIAIIHLAFVLIYIIRTWYVDKKEQKAYCKEEEAYNKALRDYYDQEGFGFNKKKEG